MPPKRPEKYKGITTWLVKTEPDVYSVDDLARDKVTLWDGVRNYEARNILRDGMRKGDEVLLYHSNADPPGVVGVGEVVREGYPDPSAFDEKHHYFDPKTDPENPRWYVVDIKLDRKLKNMVTLDEVRANPKLKDMALLTRQRLSVQPVRDAEFREILKMSGE